MQDHAACASDLNRKLIFLFGFDFKFVQFPSVKFSDMLKPDRVWQEETFKIEKSRGCQGSFFVFSIFCVFWLSENLVFQIFLIN